MHKIKMYHVFYNLLYFQLCAVFVGAVCGGVVCTCMQCLQKPEKDVGFSGVDVTDGCKLPSTGAKVGSSGRAAAALNN